MFVYADAISIRILRVRALLAARGPFIERRKSWKLPATAAFETAKFLTNVRGYQ